VHFRCVFSPPHLQQLCACGELGVTQLNRERKKKTLAFPYVARRQWRPVFDGHLLLVFVVALRVLDVISGCLWGVCAFLFSTVRRATNLYNVESRSTVLPQPHIDVQRRRQKKRGGSLERSYVFVLLFCFHLPAQFSVSVEWGSTVHQPRTRCSVFLYLSSLFLLEMVHLRCKHPRMSP
jgi:hypothetical protein